MNKNFTKHFWIFISSFGVGFATVSWIYEGITQGLWWKGALALILGFTLYKVVITKI